MHHHHSSSYNYYKARSPYRQPRRGVRATTR